MHINSFIKFLSKRKLYTVINLFGLAVSLMFVILIADYAVQMLDVDRYYPRSKDIYVLGKENGYSSNYVNSAAIAEMIPEIEKKCSIIDYEANVYSKADDNTKNETAILFADSTFFDFFAFPFIYGNSKTALDSPEKAVITESLALELFGSTDVLGSIVTVSRNKKEASFTVSAVIKNLNRTVLPNKTELITLVDNTRALSSNDFFTRDVIMSGAGCCKTLFMALPKADIQSKTPIMLEYLKENDWDYKLADRKEVILTPISKMMLDERNKVDGFEHGNRQILLILLTAGIAILLFAITNYINLTVAQTGFRAKEMASRKLLGASGKSVTFRLIIESTLITLIAFIIGFLLALLCQKSASSLCGSQIDILSHFSWKIAGAYLLFILVIGAVSGCIPAYVISRYKPIDIVKGALRFRSKMVFSKIFMVFQNVITAVMIVCSTTVYLQIRHLVNAPLGHNVKDIIEFVDWNMTEPQFNSFVSELKSLPCIEDVGVGGGCSFFSGMASMTSFKDKDGNERWINIMNLDSAAVKILGLELLSDNHPGSGAIWLNEKAAQALGASIDDREFSINHGDGDMRKILGGIYRDFKTGTVLNDCQATMITPKYVTPESYQPGILFYLKVKGDRKEVLDAIKAKYKSVTDKECNEISYGDDIIREDFSKERSISIIILVFTIIAIIISALGLFAMSTYFTSQRINEIGLRKIFGGTRKEILLRQLWHFIIPLLISIIIAVPVAYYIMEQWLMNYSYRMAQSPWVYMGAILLTLTIGVLTVLGESLKAVNQNPVKSIRVE